MLVMNDFCYFLLVVFLFVLIVVVMNIGLWWWGNQLYGLDDWYGLVNGFLVLVFQCYQNLFKKDFFFDVQIDSDLKLLCKYIGCICIYFIQENLQIYCLVWQDGLKVMVGVNIDMCECNNECEIDQLIVLVNCYLDIIEWVIVGNEVLFCGDLLLEQMICYFDCVCVYVCQLVLIVELDYIWIKYLELVEYVDFIIIYLFLFWNGIGINVDFDCDDVLNVVFGVYDNIQCMYLIKYIVVGEIGWLFNGDCQKYVCLLVFNEVIFICYWFNVVKVCNIDYYLFEVFDQLWKENLGEGCIGVYWGMFNVDWQMKFLFIGLVIEDIVWLFKVLVVSLLVLILMLWFGCCFSWFKLMGWFFFVVLIQFVCGLIVWLVMLLFNFYLSWVDWMMLVLLFLVQIVILVILLINGFEFIEVLW